MNDRKNYPTWVKIGLFDIPTRIGALAQVSGCIGLSIISLIAAFWNPLYFIGLSLGAVAAWCGAAIKWVDHNDRW
jgi:hypothetical protein